jgi:TPR repeat protein
MYGTGKGAPMDHLRAHMWVNLAGSLGNKAAGDLRDATANLMTPQQVAQAQKMAVVCLARNFKNCD